MARRSKIHVGLEIGTSKTCLVVGEVKADSAVKILGIGETKSVGVRKGEIYDYSQIRACLKDAISKAEEASDVEIGSVFLAVTGSHIVGVNNRGCHRVPDHQKIITSSDIEEARASGRHIHLNQDQIILHPIPRTFWLDGLEHTTPPHNLYGKTIEADFHIIHAIASRIQNSVKLIREISLEVDDVVFSPIATAQMAIERDARDNGALLIDIGGGTTDYALYLNGSIAASGCIPVGGDHVTNDIHLGTGLPFSKAERLKITEGTAAPDQTNAFGDIRVNDERGYLEVEIKRAVLNQIIRERLEETLRLVIQKLPPNAMDGVNAGVFLTGGTSLMRGFTDLAAHVFRRDVYRPDTGDLDGSQTNFKDPRYATAIGLIRYAQFIEAQQRPPRGLMSQIKKYFWPFGQ